MRRGGYKCRTLKIHRQLRDQQLKTILRIYIDSYQNFRVTAKKKNLQSIHKQIRKINSNTTLKIVIKPEEERTRKEGKKKEQQKQIRSNE